MGKIRHDKPRHGFSGWPSEHNTLGKGGEGVAKVAYPDPQWKADNENRHKKYKKTPTGEAIATKMCDLRIRGALAGKTCNPRLIKKTSPMAI